MIVVTGATGFLGGRYVRHCLSQGLEVMALGRDREKLEALRKEGALTHSCDLAALEPQDIPQAQVIVHAAARSAPFGAYTDFVHDNVHATRKVIDVVRAHEARMIYISTPAVYAQFKDQENVSEMVALPKPINAYAHTKRQAEKAVEALCDRQIILRPRGIYGKGETALLPRMLSAAQAGPIPLLRGGSARTDITHVCDVVAAIEAARLADNKAWGETYNIAGPYGCTITKVIRQAAARAGQRVEFLPVPWPVAYGLARGMEKMARISGKEPRLTPYSLLLLAYTQTLSTAKARQLLKWAPRVVFEQGLDEVFGG